MKYQIAIVTRQMITGGVEKALIEMLKRFDYGKVDIDLYLLFSGGELLKDIPKNVNINYIKTVNKDNIMKYPITAIKKIICLLWLKNRKLDYVKQNWISNKMLLPIKKEYDVAISYHAPNTVPVFFTIDKIKARKKILWLHGDVKKNGGNNPYLRKYYFQYDKVYSVSKSVQDSFLEEYPEMKNKIHLFYNYVDIDSIRMKAKTGPTFSDNFKGFRILSIGRLSEQKGFDIAICACEILLRKGYEFRWYICGDGEERKNLELLIEEKELKDNFILMGNQENPYGFLKDSDLYVQPSRFEGYCTTTNEARILFKPVITTRVSGAEEQFINGITGWLVSINAEEIAYKIEWCLNNLDEMHKVSQNARTCLFEIEEDIERIYEG